MGSEMCIRDRWHYIEQELLFSSLVGPFKPEELPFKFFRSPFGSVLKKLSKWRRTVTDCSQLAAGINAFIDPQYHRAAPWKLTLPNSMSIVRAIMRTRAQYPNQHVEVGHVTLVYMAIIGP